MAARVFTVLAAVFLIVAFAAGTLAPPDMPLGAALFLLDKDALLTAQAAIQGTVSPWIWAHIFVPVLLRPSWLMPTAIAIVCGGTALSLTSRTAHRSRRRS
jgi:hypothetical protein